ncbi:MAG: hypothetical protein E5Y89_21005 [Mesorhizobium sp.]|nr:MAG: hypothetical protein E5Y89_21005 [Mesorhizobium sp.]
MDDQFEAIAEEAVTILRIMKKLLDAKRAAAPASEKVFPTLSAADLAARPAPPPRGEPRPDANTADAFRVAIRWWARRAASALEHEQWDRMIWAAKEAVPDYPGDQIRFFENVFADLRLRDGFLVIP